jgi:hypothetical protein
MKLPCKDQFYFLHTHTDCYKLTSNEQGQKHTVREESSEVRNLPRGLYAFNETQIQEDP